MPNRQKNSNIVTYLIIFFLAAIIAYTFYVMGLFGVVKIEQKEGTNNTTYKQQTFTSSFSNVTAAPYPVAPGVSNRYVSAQNLIDINQTNKIVTYENNFGIVGVKPNINKVPVDILDNLAHLDNFNTVDSCLYEDQIAVEYVTKDCSTLRCIDSFGNRIIKGTSIAELNRKKDMPYCQNQSLGHVSFNFNINPNTNGIDTTARFMEIDTIYTGQTIFDTLSADPGMDYYMENNLFQLNTDLPDPNMMVPRIVHRPYNDNIFNQKIIIKRYSEPIKQGEADFQEKNDGNLAEIIFRPGNLYLSSIAGSGSLAGITPLPDNTSGNFQDFIKVRKVTQGTNSSALVVAISEHSVYVIYGGSGYTDTDNIIIEGSGTEGNHTFIPVIGSDRQIVFKRREGADAKDRAVWLLSPAIDMTPKGITKNNKLTKGYILDFSSDSNVDGFSRLSDQNLAPRFTRVAPGEIISPIQYRSNIGSLPVASGVHFYHEENKKNVNNWLAEISQNNTKIGGANFTVEGYGYSEPSTDLDFSYNTKVILNNNLYLQYPDYLLKAVNKSPGFAGGTTIEGLSIKVQVFTETPIALAGTTKKYTAVASLGDNPQTLDNSDSNTEGFYINDGEVIWEKIPTFTETLAFESEYFTDRNLGSGLSTVVQVSGISAPNLKFKDFTLGQVSSIDILASDFSEVNLPQNLSNNTRIFDLDDTLIQPVVQPGASPITIGTSAKAIFYFSEITSDTGTSVIINSIDIFEKGANYTAGEYSILASGISTGLSGSIKNVNIKTSANTFLFESVPYHFNSNSGVCYTFNNNEISGDTIASGLVINPKTTDKGQIIYDIQPINRTFAEQGNTEIIRDGVVYGASPPTILKSGSGYRDRERVYINQLDENLISVFGVSYTGNNLQEKVTNLPYVDVLGINTLSSIRASSYPLFKDNSQKNYLIYNFWEGSDSTSGPNLDTYGESPTQIIYYGDSTERNLLRETYVGSMDNDLLKFFLENKDPNTPYNNINFVTSLQVPSFTYGISSSPTNGVCYSINNYEGLALKRFVPYREFRPPKSNGRATIPVVKGTSTYIYPGFLEFVPYGVKNIYNQQITDYSQIGSL